MQKHIKDAAVKMASLNIGALPVADRSHLVGMITDRDITVRAVAKGLDPNTTTVDSVMSDGVVECNLEDDLNDVADLMERHGLRRVVVVNAQGKPVGIVSVDDLAWRAPDKQLAAEALHRRPNGNALTVPR